MLSKIGLYLSAAGFVTTVGSVYLYIQTSNYVSSNSLSGAALALAKTYQTNEIIGIAAGVLLILIGLALYFTKREQEE